MTGWRGILLIALLLLAPAPSRATRLDSGIRGIVFRADTDGPAVGVRVRTGDSEATTNRDGAFRIWLPPGTYALALEGGGLGPVETEPVRVEAGELTEVLATLATDGAPPLVVAEVPGAEEGARSRERSDGPRAVLRGRVVHADTGRGIRDVRLFVRGLPIETRTGPRGHFELTLPLGPNDVTFIHPEFGTVTKRDTEVLAEGTPTLDVELTPSAYELAAFRVTEPRIEGGTVELLQERRETGSVSDIIGAEQMSKAGDSDAAAALKRVTGVTVVGGKYVYVRGLGERYSSTLLNGSTLPSPEPERRVVPLDMFPAGLLESVVIQKSYSPDLPGEFAGGTVQVRTRGYPSEFLFEVGLSTGVRLGTTFLEGPLGPVGPTDFLGIDGGYRALPAAVDRASRHSSLAEGDRFTAGFSETELEAFGEMMSNRWTPRDHLAPPDLGLSATVGHSFDVAGAKAGFLAALTYDNGWSHRKRRATIYVLGSDDELEPAHRYAFDELENKIVLAGVLDMGVDFSPQHRLRLTTLVDRITTSEGRLYEGPNRDVGADIRVTRLRWIERMLVAQQVRGEHEIPAWHDTKISWRYTFSMATRDEPDRRELRYDNEPGTEMWLLSDRPEGNQRVFSALEDQNHDLGLDVRLPFSQWSGEEALAKAGLSFVLKDRSVDTRRFKFRHKGALSGDTDVVSRPAAEIFVPAYIGPDGFQLEEITRETDNYSAEQPFVAGYLMTELPLGAGFRLLAGLRAEWSRQRVRTFELFNPDAEPVLAELETLDWLPGMTLTWAFVENMQLRAGYGRTVSRPDFRELSPATFNDVTGGRQIFGNPDLQRAIIHNADLRWEWYLGPGESLSLGAFYKRFEKPIETIVVVSAQHSVSYDNAEGAHNVGVELEFRKSFDLLHEALADLSLSGNATYVFSRVDLAADSGIQTSKSRPLQGQSPFVINLQLGYDNVDWGTSLALLYHVFGRRIENVGALGAPDVYEQPAHQLDFVYKQALGAGFQLSFKAQNLLDPVIRRTQGGETTETYRRGRAFSLGLSYAW